MRVAFFSDIHGNLLALEAVLADIETADCTDLVCLGDICTMGPQPKACLDRVRGLDCVVLQGNHELYVLGQHMPDDWERNPLWTPTKWTQHQLDAADLAYLRTLPITFDLPKAGERRTIATHASPVSQFTPLKSDIPYHKIGENLGYLADTYLFCEHTHAPLFYQWESSYIINPGSVGVPLDGTRHAKYAIATLHDSGWHIEFRQVAYDYEAVQQSFITTGLQATNPLLFAAVRHQLALGRGYLFGLIREIRMYAQERNAAVADIYDAFPIPDELRSYLEE